jgi:hypothetical protein
VPLQIDHHLKTRPSGRVFIFRKVKVKANRTPKWDQGNIKNALISNGLGIRRRENQPARVAGAARTE